MEYSYPGRNNRVIPLKGLFLVKKDAGHFLLQVPPHYPAGEIFLKKWTKSSCTAHLPFLSSQESFLWGGTVSMYRFAMYRQMMMPVMFPIVSPMLSYKPPE